MVRGQVLPDVDNSRLQPITKILCSITGRGAKRKSLWMDGLRLEFCAMMWQYIKEGMLFTMKFSCRAVFKLTRKWGY
jgi:hypothetical protein